MISEHARSRKPASRTWAQSASVSANALLAATVTTRYVSANRLIMLALSDPRSSGGTQRYGRLDAGQEPTGAPRVVHNMRRPSEQQLRCGGRVRIDVSVPASGLGLQLDA